MEQRKVVRVAVEKATFHFDKLFDYAVPIELSNRVQRGCRVLVPFGKSNQKIQGLVFEVAEKAEYEKGCKLIRNVLDEKPVVDDEGFRIIEYLKNNTFCTYYDALRVLLPVGLNVDVVSTYHLARRIDEIELQQFSEEEQSVLAFLKTARNKSELNRWIEQGNRNALSKTIRGLIEKGVVIVEDQSRRRVGDETIRMVRICSGFDPSVGTYSPKQRTVLSLLEEVQVASVKELCYLCGVTEAVVKALVKKGAAEYYERQVYRRPKSSFSVANHVVNIKLSPEQLKAFSGIYDLICKGKPEVALLHGVTGSGKTSVFLKLIEVVIAQGRQVIMMVPEISLTPQMASQFITSFGDKVAVIHSGLSLGERLDEYKRIRDGIAKIVVGTRSAVFSPLKNIGLIIMDEEGEMSYKSESAPRYHARDIAKLRCVEHHAVLLLASATPSIDSYYHAKCGRYHLFEMKERYSNANLPDVYLVDLKEHLLSDRSAVLSDVLIDELYYNLQHGEQSMLLLNRRGYHTYSACIDCGTVDLCPNCSVAMTYHKANGLMMCHYCGYSHRQDFTCKACGGNHIKLTGLGTQKLEDEVARLFPDARILRMDTDTTYSRYAYEQEFERFSRGEYDIMLGTQMIAKGLDFPNVTLVGVLAVDKLLYATDFRGNERTFSLITQVVGRSGRGDKRGRAYIETYTPDHPVLNFAAHQNYPMFYNDEIQARKALLYPPFCDICVVGFACAEEALVQQGARLFIEFLKEYMHTLEKKLPLRVLGPVPAGVYKINGKYRYRIVIKCRAGREFRKMVACLLKKSGTDKRFAKLNLFADINGEINV